MGQKRDVVAPKYRCEARSLSEAAGEADPPDESWRQSSLLRREPTVPISYLTTVVVGDLEGYLHFFSNFDGDPVARVRVGSKAISVEPVVVANRLFVQSDDGKISAYVIQQPESPGDVPPVTDGGA